MDKFLDELQLMLVETESIHQTLSPLCSRFKVSCEESYHDRKLQETSVLFDRSQPVTHLMESSIDNANAAGSGISEEEKKLAVRYPQLQNQFDALNAKFLEAEKRLRELEVQAKLDNEMFNSARSVLAEQVEVHKMAAEEANSKLAKALSTTSTGTVTQSSLAARSSTTAPGSSAFGPQYPFAIYLSRISLFYH